MNPMKAMQRGYDELLQKHDRIYFPYMPVYGFARGIYTPPLASGITAITNKACSSTQRQSLPQGMSLQLKVAHAKMGSGRE